MHQRLSTLAFRNVRKNWRHTLSALLSIVAAYFSIVFFEGYISNLVELYYDGYHSRNMYADFLVENIKAQSIEGRADPLSVSVSAVEQAALLDFKKRHLDLIKESARFLNLSGSVTNGKSSAIFFAKATDIQEGKKIREPHWNWNATYGKPLHEASQENSVLIGMGLARTMSCHPINTVKLVTSPKGYVAEDRPFHCDTNDLQLSVSTESGQLNALDVEVVGFIDGGYQEIDKRFISMSIPLAQQLMNTDKVSYVTFLLNDGTKTSLFEKLFQEEVQKKYPNLGATRWQDHIVGELYRRTLDLMSIFRNFIVLLIISITTLSVMNTSIKAIKERTQEIGTLRSLGFEAQHIRELFLWESFYLSSMGIGVGILSALLVSFIVNNLGIHYKAGILSMPVSFGVNFDFWAYFFAAFVLVLIGLIVTVIICKGTLNKKIVENLGHV